MATLGAHQPRTVTADDDGVAAEVRAGMEAGHVYSVLCPRFGRVPLAPTERWVLTSDRYQRVGWIVDFERFPDVTVKATVKRLR